MEIENIIKKVVVGVGDQSVGRQGGTRCSQLRWSYSYCTVRRIRMYVHSYLENSM